MSETKIYKGKSFYAKSKELKDLDEGNSDTIPFPVLYFKSQKNW